MPDVLGFVPGIVVKHTDIISWLLCGYVTSSAMMENKEFSSSKLRVFSFLMYSATTLGSGRDKGKGVGSGGDRREGVRTECEGGDRT